MSKNKIEKMDSISQMDSHQLARWYGLIMAMESVGEHCQKNRINIDNVFISAVHIKHYVDSKFDFLVKEIERDRENTKKKRLLKIKHTKMNAIEKKQLMVGV